MLSQDKKRRRFQQVIRLITAGLVIASAVKKLRIPVEERTWHGVVAGFVPYDLRMPTVDRFHGRMWDPHGENFANLVHPASDGP